MYTKRNCFLLLAAFLLAALGVQAQDPCNLSVTIAVPDLLTCQTPSVELQATVTPPGNDYIIEWSGPASLPGVLNPTVTTEGWYDITVIDPVTFCVARDTVVVKQDGSIPTVAILITGTTCDGSPVLTAAPIVGGPGYSFLWSTGATTPTISVPAGVSQTYCVTITDTNSGCSSSSCRNVSGSSFPPFSAQINYFDSPFCNDSLGPWVFTQGGMPPFAYQWNNGNTSPWLPNIPSPGTYIVTVTDANGCTAVATIVIENDPFQCATLEGAVLADWNENCAADMADEGLAHRLLIITDADGDVFYAYTRSDGLYSVELFPGTYTIEVTLPGHLWTACQASYTVTVAANTVTTRDFLLQSEVQCPAMSIDLGTPFLRRCFESTYWMRVTNQGTIAATDAYVEIKLDPFLTIVSATTPYTNLGNNLLHFDLGTVPVNHVRWINMVVLVSCDAVLGQAHCSEAVAYPTGTCEPPNPQWSGASLQVEANCETDTVDFAIRNIGFGPMSVPLEYVVIEDAVMLMQAPPPTILLAPSTEHHVRVPANGATWRVEVAQEPLHPGTSMPSQSVEGCTNGGQFSIGFINQFPQDDNNPWVDVDCTTNVGAYDPNDKQGFPIGYGAAHHIEPGTDIEYLIRFQNTGTDTAFTVVVRDTLSAWLDPATVRPGASSHPYSFEFYGGNNIKFIFENILLPDSSTNLDASQGFVKFRISQKTDVPLQTDILNSAAIFFDFNEPIITNTTIHRVGREFVTVSAWQPFRSGLSLRVLPNPVAQNALLELSGIEGSPDWQVELRDAIGRTVRTDTATGTQWRFERGDLPAGLYLLQIRTDGQLLGTSKVVLR